MAPKKTEVKKKSKSTTPVKKSSSRVKKNKILYANKIVIRNNKVSKILIGILVMSLAVNTFTIYHFLTFNHNKVKIVTKVKEKEVVPENIVFLGDSITHQYDLEKYYGDDLSIVNSGEDGHRTIDVLKNIKKRVYDYNPSKIFILLGTNDIIDGKSETEIVDSIKNIIEKIKEKREKCKIYLESIYPINDTDDKKVNHDMVHDRTNDFIKKTNKKLQEYASKNNITYINMYDKLTDEEGNLNLEYTKEGLHISDKGYEIITKEIKKYLKDE